MSGKTKLMEINMDDCVRQYTTSNGFKVYFMDTFCRDMTPERKEEIDAGIIRIYNQIQARCAAEGKLDAIPATVPG